MQQIAVSPRSAALLSRKEQRIRGFFRLDDAQVDEVIQRRRGTPQVFVSSIHSTGTARANFEVVCRGRFYNIPALSAFDGVFDNHVVLRILGSYNSGAHAQSNSCAAQGGKSVQPLHTFPFLCLTRSAE